MLVHGAEVYGIATIIKLYAKRWQDMTFVCFGEGAMHEWLVENGNRVVTMAIESRLKATGSPLKLIANFRGHQRDARRLAEQTAERIRNRDIRVVHTHRLSEQIVAGQMRPLGFKSVWQINNNSNRKRLAGFGLFLNHRLARWGADLLLPASDFIAANWQGCGVPMRTIRNAAEKIVDFRDAPPAPPLRCVVAGRLEHSKGHHTAIDAVIKARAAGKDVRLDVFGGPVEGNSYCDELQAKIKLASASDAIQLRGFCSDLRQRHGDFHLGLQCRIDPEPCSLWVCETMVDGLPVLASATGGTPELVDDGVTGLLYPPGDTNALADHLINLSERPKRLESMRHAAHQRGQDHFLIERLAHETLEAYRSLFG